MLGNSIAHFLTISYLVIVIVNSIAPHKAPAWSICLLIAFLINCIMFLCRNHTQLILLMLFFLDHGYNMDL